MTNQITSHLKTKFKMFKIKLAFATDNVVCKTRESKRNNIKTFGTRIENFKQSFFPFSVNKYKLDISVRKAKYIRCFQSVLMDFINLKQKSLIAIHDPAGVIIKAAVNV